MQPSAYVPSWDPWLTAFMVFVALGLVAAVIGLFLRLRFIDRVLKASRDDVIKMLQARWRERRHEVPRRNQKQQHRIRPL